MEGGQERAERLTTPTDHVSALWSRLWTCPFRPGWGRFAEQRADPFPQRVENVRVSRGEVAELIVDIFFSTQIAVQLRSRL